MKSIAMLMLSIGCWAGTSGCEPSPEESGPPFSQQAELAPELERSLAQEPPAVCFPISNTAMTGAGGLYAYANAAFWLLDVPCGVPNVEELRAKITFCLSGGSCGNPIDFNTVAALVAPFEQNKGVLARVGAAPVELFRGGGRIRVLFDREHDPVSVLYALRGSSLPPKPPCPPTGCFGAGAAPSGEGSSETGQVGASLAGLDSLGELIAAFPCCPGCGPCSQGQCEPRPGATPRIASETRYECSPCDQTCNDPALAPDCPCLQRCIQLGRCE